MIQIMGVHLFFVSEILRNLSKFAVKFTKKLKMYRKDIISRFKYWEIPAKITTLRFCEIRTELKNFASQKMLWPLCACWEFLYLSEKIWKRTLLFIYRSSQAFWTRIRITHPRRIPNTSCRESNTEHSNIQRGVQYLLKGTTPLPKKSAYATEGPRQVSKLCMLHVN